jgi:multiple sugar transport system ATP-binding protein
MATVTLEQVSKRFPGGTFALANLDLEVRDGEFLVLVGPSGCGKSTTLNLVAGLEQADAGEIRIDGARVNEASPGARDVAMVFQSYALYPHLTVRENLAFPLRVAKVDRAIREARVLETAARLELSELLDRKPAALSGGQRQRVALGRALVRRPKVFLFDEPLSNLDAGLRTQTRGELKRLHRALGATFLYVTHDQVEAMTLADRVAVLDGGVLQQLGTPREVYDAPANRFVARFFGTPPINLVAPEVLGLDPQPGVEVGLRPEWLEAGVGSPPAGALEGTIDLVEPLGAEAWVTIVVQGARLIAKAPPDFPGRPGEQAWLRVPRKRAIRFDEGPGR